MHKKLLRFSVAVFAVAVAASSAPKRAHAFLGDCPATTVGTIYVYDECEPGMYTGNLAGGLACNTCEYDFGDPSLNGCMADVYGGFGPDGYPIIDQCNS